MNRRILLLGSNGQVGWELQRTLMPLGEVVAASRGGNHGACVDLNRPEALSSLLERESPDLIVNAAAYTAVDKAEAEPAVARRINTDVPRIIGEWASNRQCSIVHFSTDYVFDGTKETPYDEEDEPNPLGVYGQTKLEGDQALIASGAAAVILRVSWVYGLRGQNFLLTMRRLMQERDRLTIVDDQHGAPTWSRAIAETSALAASRLITDPNQAKQLAGIYHLSPGGSTTWYGFAAAIKSIDNSDCELLPIPTSAYPTPAARPMNSRLDSGKLQRVFGLRLPEWESMLKTAVEQTG